jgi:hypothetical protein
MRRAVLLILALCFLTSITRPGFSEKPLRLFFEKKIDVEAKPGEDHIVQEGEWLLKILQQKGYSGSQIQQLIPGIQALNPHIPDVNRLKPGQMIQIPENSFTPNPPPQAKKPAPLPPASYEKMPYVVRTGDTLVQILQAKGVPTRLIYSKYMSLFMELNPDIPDGNSLRAGQEVILPVMEQTAGAQAPATPPPPQMASRPAPVAADQGSSPRQSFGKPNAGGSPPAMPAKTPLSTPPALPPQMPAPAPIEAVSNATAASKETPEASQTNASVAAPDNARTQITGLPFIKTVLEQMRFRFVPGDESMLPLPGSGWLHVKMLETPLVETPWGGRLVFCPVPKNAEWVESATRLGIKICTISSNWSLQEVLDKLASSFPNQFRLWGAGRDLVLSQDGISLTLQSPQLTIMERSGTRNIHMIWSRQSPGEPPLPQGLHEVLDLAKVKVIELDAYNELSRLPARQRESIYVPEATHLELIRAINPNNPEELFGQTMPGTLTELLQLLRSKDMLHQGMAQASWSGGLRSRIAVQVPAWTVSESASKIALLDRRFADPFLVSVLANQGYSCFILPE